MTQQPNNVSAAGVLQPCPFCGGKAVLNALGTHASCSKCTFLPQLFISEWNRRAAASAQATGQAVPEGYKLVPAEPTDEMVDAACPVGEVVDHFDMKMALRSGIAAAPSPAAREAGDVVTLTDDKLKALIRKVEDELGIVWFIPDDSERYLWRTITTNERDKFVRALLREAGSR